MKNHRKWTTALATSAFAIAAGLMWSQRTAAADDAAPGAITMTVTAVGRKDAPPPPVKKEDVQFLIGKERTQVADWRKGETLYLAVLIDDSLESNVALQWNDLKAFMLAQPENTYLAVAYARNGAAMVAQDFTKDHDLAAKALRMPTAFGGAFTSPYLALQDWVKRWPASNERKSILMISSGIDYFRGTFDTTDPDVDTVIEQAQKKNINVWSIYAADAGHRAHSNYVLFLSQGFLSRVSEQTGGESFYNGYIPAVTFKPYLDELQMHLNNQYLLTFVGKAEGKGRFEHVRVGTELHDVEFLAAPQAFVPPAK